MKRIFLMSFCFVLLLCPCIDASSAQRQQAVKDALTGMEFIPVPGGCFQMGCGSRVDDCEDDARPAHEVCVDAFLIGKYEVTQAEWEKVMGSNPSNFRKGGNYPVEWVSWNDAQEFIRKLNALDSGGSYRLPTEAEWEYAARSGGKEEVYAGGNDYDPVAWHFMNAESLTHPAGSKAPNGLGIYDMSGNVSEWVADVYDRNAYTRHARANPMIESPGTARVYRGGSWTNGAKNIRTTFRDHGSPGSLSRNLGFRLVKIK